MPELPEVETMRRGIAPCVGGRIEVVQRPRCRLKPITMTPGPAALRRRLVGTTITGTLRAGKRVVLQLDSQNLLVLEPRMTGLVLIADPPDTEHLRLVLQLSAQPRPSGRARGKSRCRQLVFWDRRGLGTIRLYTPPQFADKLGPQILGPDALTITAAQYQERLGSSRRDIKVALLDQAAIAGIGNLYAAEILHVSGIHPQVPCSRLRVVDWNKIAAATRSVLAEAIRYEGSTLSDGTYRNALNRKGRYQSHHRVYGRTGERCHRCRRGKIRRIVQSQRSTFFCPVCQQPRG